MQASANTLSAASCGIGIVVSKEIRSACPAFRGGALYAEFTNAPTSAAISAAMREEEDELRRLYTTDTVKLVGGIAATRAAYKACGKDPSRYRPSNEQLVRRVLQGKELWSVNAAVDLGNLASMRFAYSIGCFDRDKISGPTLTLGIGRAGEPYEGIGRGPLNIDGLPVYRDAAGGVGTPTSDNERTKMSLDTTRMLAVVNGFDGDEAHIAECLAFMADVYGRYLGARTATFTYQ